MLPEPFPFRICPPEAVHSIIFTTAQRGSAGPEWLFWDIFDIEEGFSRIFTFCRTPSLAGLIFIPSFSLSCLFFSPSRSELRIPGLSFAPNAAGGKAAHALPLDFCLAGVGMCFPEAVPGTDERRSCLRHNGCSREEESPCDPQGWLCLR